jgi:hypothetical protein
MPVGGGHYEFRIRGRLSDTLLPAFEGLNASIAPVDTVLRGLVRDQSELYGVLARMQALGLELVALQRLPDTTADVNAADAQDLPRITRIE